jgi:hypothetical protein
MGVMRKNSQKASVKLFNQQTESRMIYIKTRCIIIKKSSNNTHMLKISITILFKHISKCMCLVHVVVYTQMCVCNYAC